MYAGDDVGHISLATAGPTALKLEEFTKNSGPAKVLIGKIFGAASSLNEPNGKILAAHADVQVESIKILEQLDLTATIQQRTLARMVRDQERIQANLESIAALAAESLDLGAKPEEMDDDWIADVLEKCKNISNSEMQSLWAKIMAGEANKKKSFSKYTIQVVSSLEKEDAVLFTKLCGYVWQLKSDPVHCPLVFSLADSIYKSQGIDYGALRHLESLGLISFNPSLNNIVFPSSFTVAAYRGRAYRLSKPEASLFMHTGFVALTYAGVQLSHISGSVEVPQFQNYVNDKWKAAGFMVEEMKDCHHD